MYRFIHVYIELLRVNEAYDIPFNSHTYMGHLVDIQTALRPLQKSIKIEIKFMIIFGLAESFKSMNPPDPA